MQKVRLVGSGRIVEVSNQDAFAMTDAGKAVLVTSKEAAAETGTYNDRKLGAKKNVAVKQRPYHTRKN